MTFMLEVCCPIHLTEMGNVQVKVHGTRLVNYKGASYLLIKVNIQHYVRTVYTWNIAEFK